MFSLTDIYSTGTACSKLERILWTVQMGLLSAPLPPEIHSDIHSKLANSPVLTGTILISASLDFCFHVTNSLKRSADHYLGVQYCDGVRGGFVIYDDEDPHRSMYDGKQQT